MSKSNFLCFLGLSLFTLLFSHDCLSQGTGAIAARFTHEQILTATDVEGALNADRVRKIELLSSPKGSGNKIEAASSNANDLYHFEKEHNIVWIKFTAIKTSGLAFTIIPYSEKDDYDFLLFKTDEPNTVTKIRKQQMQPIRSNMARTKEINQGYTGLRLNEENTHTGAGLNTGYSQSIDVKDGEVFYLAIDNVYDNGEGATIDFMYFEEQLMQGTVMDSDNRPVEAEVIWENAETGVELAKTTSNPEDGTFKIIVPYEEERTSRYTMTIFSNNYDCLFKEISYAPVEIETKSKQKLSVILPKLKKGAISQLSSVNFRPSRALFLESAYPSLRRLTRLMKKNKALNIHIIGHTNGCQGGHEKNQELSESRAKITREYLIKKGISASRMTTEGRNCTEMLFPNTSSPRLQRLNRRIEISVTSY